MKQSQKIVLIILGTLISFSGFGAKIESISVFVNHEQSKNVTGCNNVKCNVFEIDAVDKSLDEFFGKLPDNQEDALRVVKEKIATPKWKAHEKKIIDAQKSVVTAFEYGISKYPAIVINSDSVTYGITDVNQAISDYNNHNRDKE